ncbi:hypothetical protein O6H91_10G061500 [Diphasiastrum complanatum]|nr:hypothetical protein O6H91_10G061500 [Diphasiastrum complanatum]
MFKLMQKKALQLYMQAEAQRTSGHNLEQNSPTADDDSVANSNAAADDVDPAADYHRSSQGQERGSRKERIARKLEAALMPTLLEVEDVSHEHAGHAGVQGSSGETHFNLKVVSSKFEGRSLVKRHRLVYELLQEELETGLHALSIVAKTPSEVDKV